MENSVEVQKAWKQLIDSGYVEETSFIMQGLISKAVTMSQQIDVLKSIKSSSEFDAMNFIMQGLINNAIQES